VISRFSDRKGCAADPTERITPEGTVLVVQSQDQAPVMQKIKVGIERRHMDRTLSGLNEEDWIARRVFAVQGS